MYKTDLEILNSHIDFSQDGLIPRQNALEAMRQYAEQEVKKHLEIAAESATTKTTEVYNGGLNPDSDLMYDFVEIIDRESITGIKIELT